jgi:hypothetical protein
MKLILLEVANHCYYILVNFPTVAQLFLLAQPRWLPLRKLKQQLHHVYFIEEVLA